MTPIKTLGISIFVAVLLLLVSCNTLTHIQKSATVLEETSKYYINDSLSFSYQMGGDYNQIIPKKEIRKHLKKIDKSLHLKNNSSLLRHKCSDGNCPEYR